MQAKHTVSRPKRRRPSEDELLDLLAPAIIKTFAVYGMKGAGPGYTHITREQLSKGRFVKGATQFVIDDEGVVYTGLKVRTADLRRRPRD